MAESRHFRKAAWGMGKVEVTALEVAEFTTESDDQLTYRGELIGSPCWIFYNFSGGVLVSGSYCLDSADVVDVGDYFQLKEMFTKKYGDPWFSEPIWKDSLRRPSLDTAEDAGAAVASGLLEFRSTWDTPQTQISLVLTNQDDEYNALLFVFYSDRNHLEAERDTLLENDLDLL